jgi:hypothetical protein
MIRRVVAQKIKRAESLHRRVDCQSRGLLGTNVGFDDPDTITELRQRSSRACTGLRVAIDGDD